MPNYEGNADERGSIEKLTDDEINEKIAKLIKDSDEVVDAGGRHMGGPHWSAITSANESIALCRSVLAERNAPKE